MAKTGLDVVYRYHYR